MDKYFLNHCRVFDTGDDLDVTAAFATGFYVCIAYRRLLLLKTRFYRLAQVIEARFSAAFWPASSVEQGFLRLPRLAGVFNALISSGRIELLQSSELRIRLANWKCVYNELLDDLLPLKQFTFDTVIPYAINKGLPVGGSFKSMDISFGETVPYRTLSDQPEVLAKMFDDPQLQTMLEVRMGILVHADQEYEATLTEIAEILTEIEALTDS